MEQLRQAWPTHLVSVRRHMIGTGCLPFVGAVNTSSRKDALCLALMTFGGSDGSQVQSQYLLLEAALAANLAAAHARPGWPSLRAEVVTI